MGLKEKLKETYTKIEDKWYSFLDKLEGKGIHVYKVVDFLEERNIPSFPIAIASIIVILFLAGFLVSAVLLPQSSVTLRVLDEEGNPLSEVSMRLEVAGKLLPPLETDEAGQVNFNVPLGSQVKVLPVKEGFESIEQTFTADKARLEKDLFLSPEITVQTKTIHLKDLSSKSLVEEAVIVSFSCSQRSDYTRTDTVIGGEIILDDIPLDCGNLYVIPQEYSTVTDYIDMAEAGSAEILLEPVVVDTGEVLVTVEDQTGNALAGMIAKLYTSQNSLYNQSFTGSSGIARFENVPVDSYYVTVSDDAGVYETFVGSDDVRALAKDETLSFEVILKKGVVGKIRLKLLDKATLLPVADAEVTLSKKVNGVSSDIALPVYSDAEGKVEIPVADAAAYHARIDHANYLIAEKNGLVKTPEGVFTEIFLEEATAANSRTLKVYIVDEFEEPISGARAKLYRNMEMFGSEQTTGQDGFISFERLEEGVYQVYVYKPGYGEKMSPETTVRARVENKITVTLPLGQGTLQVNVADEEGLPVSGAVITVFDAFTLKQVGETYLTGVDGGKSINLTADKRVFLYIEATDFEAYTTVPIQMVKDSTQEVNVILVEDIPKFELVFLGFYVEEENARDFLNPGQKYIARLQLKVPKESAFDEIGVHLRTGSAVEGESNITENDGLYIKSVAASAGKTLKGTSYTPSLGFAEDLLHLTNGAAKWTNLVWSKPKTGVFDIEAEIQVKNIEKGETLEFDYRAWGKVGTYVRYPVDRELKNLEQTANKQALYASTKTAFFTVGPSNLCAAGFCTILSIEDLMQGIETAIIDEYSAKVANNYKLFFTLSNASTSYYDNVKLRLYNDTQSLSFSNYTAVVKGLEESSALTGNELEINVGSFEPDEVVYGELSFHTDKDGASKLILELVAGKEIVLQKIILINVAPAKEMKLDVLPKTIVPFIKNQVVMRVLNLEDDSPIVNALVSVYLNEELIDSGNTDSRGEFELTLNNPASGSTLKIVAEKNGFKSLTKSMKISDQILSLMPEKLEEILVTTGISTKEEGIQVSNLTEIPLTLTDLTVSGNLVDFVDVKFKEDYKGLELAPGEDYNMAFQLSLNARGKTVPEPKQVEGSIDFHLYNAEFSRWTSKLELRVKIGFGDSLDAPECLIISPLQWDIFTKDETKTLEVRVKNNCEVNNKKVDLREFSAKVDYGNKNELGKFILDSEIGKPTKLTLTNAYQIIADLIPSDSDNTIVLSFDPKRMRSGEGQPKIIFKAVNKTLKGDEILELSLKTNVQINDLTKCVKVTGTENLIVESCPINLGWNNYRRYNPLQSYRPQKEWLFRAGQPTVPYGTPGYPRTAEPTTRELEMYGYRSPSQYYREPFFDYYNMGTAVGRGWACGQASFRIENSCTAPVEIDLDAHPFLNVGEAEFDLAPGEDATVKVGESVRIGKYPIKVEARIKDSDEPSQEVKTVNVVVQSPTEINQDCIRLTKPADGRFRFNNWPIVEPVEGELTNYCYDAGVRLTRDSVTEKSFKESRVTTTYVRRQDPYLKTGPEGKTIQILEFEIDKDLTYREKTPFPETETPTEWLLGVRAWTSKGYRTVEERRTMIVNYLDPYQQPRAKSILITFEDFWRSAEFDILNWGNPKIKSQECIVKGGINLGTIDEIDFAGRNYVIKKADPQVLVIDKDHCGFADRLTSLKPVEPLTVDGVTVEFMIVDAGKNIEVTVWRSPEMTKDFVDVKTELRAIVSRFYAGEKAKEVRIPVQFRVLRKGLPGLTEQEQALFEEARKTGNLEAARALLEAKKLPKEMYDKLLAALERYFAAAKVALACEGLPGFERQPEIKLLLDWRWDKVYEEKEKNCSDGKIFCDAAQFSIELSKRQAKIKTAVDSLYSYTKDELEKYCLFTKKKDASQIFDEETCRKMQNSLDYYKLIKKQIRVYDPKKPAMFFFLEKDEKLLSLKESLSKEESPYRSMIEELQKIEPSKITAEGRPTLLNIQKILENLKVNPKYQPYAQNILVLTSGAGWSSKEEEILEWFSVFLPETNEGSTFSKRVMSLNAFAEFIDFLLECTKDANATKCEIAQGQKPGMDVAFLNKFISGLEFVIGAQNKADSDEFKAEVIEKAADTISPSGYKNFAAFYKDVEFNAFLMKDNYSPAFKDAFTKAYKEADIKDWTFTIAGENGKTTLPDPGKYEAKIKYTPEGSKTEILLKYLSTDTISESAKKNVLYYLPIDASLKDTARDYGVEISSRQEFLVGKPTGFEARYTFSTGEKGLVNLTGAYRQGFEDVLGGKVLDIELQENKGSYDFTPSYPTAVGIKIVSENPEIAQVAYLLYNPEERIELTSYLFNWIITSSTVKAPQTGKGYPDFSGVTREGFVDKLLACGALGLTWAPTEIGVLTAKGTAFTPVEVGDEANRPYIKIDPDCTVNETTLFTQDTIATLDPVTEIILQDYLKVQDKVKSLQGVLEATQEALLCARISVTEAEFAWNPEKVYSKEFKETLKKYEAR